MFASQNQTHIVVCAIQFLFIYARTVFFCKCVCVCQHTTLDHLKGFYKPGFHDFAIE